MPKRTHKITAFHGGINSNTDPRDINESESVSLYDINIDKVGKLSTVGTISSTNTSNTLSILPNRGLYVLDSDRQLDGGSESETLILCFDSGSNTIDIKDSEGWDTAKISLTNVFNSGTAQAGASATITLASGADGTNDYYNGYTVETTGGTGAGQKRLISDYNGTSKVATVSASWTVTPDNTTTYSVGVASPVYYNADGVVRVSDKTFTQPSRWFGYILDERFNGYAGDSGVPGWVDSDQALTAPTKGKCLISHMRTGDDTNGITSSSAEYIHSGAGPLAAEAVNSVLEHTSLNMRVGFQLNFANGVQHSQYTILDSSCSAKADVAVDDSSAAGGLYTIIGGFASGANTDTSVFITGADDSATALDGYSSLTFQYHPRLPDEGNSIYCCFYIEDTSGGYQSGDVEYILRIGDDASNYYEWSLEKDEIVPDCWNILVCQNDNYTSTTGTPPDLDGSSASYHNVLMYKGSTSGHSPDFWSGGFFQASNPGPTGYPAGVYTFHYSWLYDESKQESLPFQFKGVGDGGSNIKNFNKIAIHKGSILFKYDFYMLPHSDASTYAISKRIVGARTYWKVEENDDYFLIGELDFVNNGFKWVPEADNVDISIANTVDTGSGIFDAGKSMIFKQISPTSANTIDTFKNINGFSTEVKSLDAQYKTAVVQGRRAYIGNIKQDGKTHPDRILKSQINKFDTFPEKMGSVDVAIRDGENIVKLETFADRILQFKENSLYIINVSENVDFLEDTYRNKGCAYPYHVTKTDYGIAWFNIHGVYFYDGKQVSNLLERNNIRLINEEDWKTFITGVFTDATCDYNNDPTIDHDDDDGRIKADLSVTGTGIPANATVVFRTNDGSFELSGNTTGGVNTNSTLTFTDSNMYYSHIGYIPKKRQLLILTASHEYHIYDFVLKSWFKGRIIRTDQTTMTNFALDSNQDLFFLSGTTSVSMKWDPSPASSLNFELQTKDIDFGEPGVRKKIYRVYITYKSGGTTNVQVKYDTNGHTDFDLTFADGTNFASNVLAYDSDNANKWIQATLKPSTSSEANGIYSFALKFSTTGTVPSTFEINDITIVYRMKSVR
tara:strand:+ start:1895 stop:5107 length:3213 start_codon:yes stop_codon:yes gene_type:complete